ncbi:hypothetical protein TL16_g08606 [Triparma laevis f. inornata]|uniref:Thioredoxin domain-containing protein n=2 Tax=Triparma laevis TaxID=1534972 RepID=A0A9W6ZQC4_9STRA|nr:hypothetical protein TrLO_g5937 [Triparma laevis f. longispina]GMH80583.1 hypothetical protein TL16_g08606 [Triparma laevis f. inornata]
MSLVIMLFFLLLSSVSSFTFSPPSPRNPTFLSSTSTSTIPILTSEALEQTITVTPPPYLILTASAIWCGPCQILAPQLSLASEILNNEYPGHGLKMMKFDVDDDDVIAGRLNVEGLPSILFFKDGKLLSKMEGAFPAEEVVAHATKVFSLND